MITKWAKHGEQLLKILYDARLRPMEHGRPRYNEAMQAIRHKVYGQKRSLADGRVVFWLQDKEDPAAAPYYLRYALTLRGPENLVFPAFLLDDWGNEINKLELYPWLRENGDLFPRAELFGFDQSGSETQHFTREFELYFKYPCFIYPDRTTPVQDGERLSIVLIADDSADAPHQTKPTADLPHALRRAHLQWWRLPTAQIPDFIDETQRA